MIIACEKCNARFRMDEKLLKPEGSKVRCKKCKQVFTAYPPPSPENQKQSENNNKTDFSEIDDLLGEGSRSEENDLFGPGEGKNSGASDDLDLSDIDDLFGEKTDSRSSGSSPGKIRKKGRIKDLEDISSEMKLSPDTADADANDYEPKVEFDETDEFSKYGTLEFNVSDMYKTLGIEVESKVDDKDLSDLDPVISAEDPGELDLSGIDDMLEVSDEELSGIGKSAPAKSDMDIDLSDLDDMLVEDENSPPAADELKLDADMNFEEDDDTVNAKTEIFNIEDINNLDLELGKISPDKSGAGKNADDDMELLELELDPDESAKDESDELPPDLMLEPEEGRDDSLNLSEASLDFEDALSDVLGEKDDDALSFEPESEISKGKSAKPEEESAELSLDLDMEEGKESEEMDFGLDMSLEEPESAKPEEESAELSLDLDMEEGKESEEMDFGLDMSLEEPESAKPEEESAELSLDLDMEEGKESEDLDLGLDMDLEEPESAKPEEESAGLSLDLDLEEGKESEDLDLGLDMSLEEPESAKPEEESADQPGGDFDLDLDFGESEDKKPPKSKEIPLDLEMAEESADQPGGDFDLDLEGEAKSGDTEFDLDFDLEESAADAKDGKDLSFDMDSDNTESKNGSDEETEIFDLDLEEAGGTEAKDDEFDLDLEMEDAGSKPETKLKPKKSDEPALEKKQSDEFDLDLEMADSGSKPEIKPKPETKLKPKKSEPALEKKESDEFEFDLDIDSPSDEAKEIQEESQGFDFGETDEASVDMASISNMETERKDDFSDAFDMGIPRDDLADISADESQADVKKDKPIIRKIPRPTNATLVILFVATMIGGGTYYAYTKNMLPKKDELRQLPYVGSLVDRVLGPQQSLGEIVPIEGSATDRFVQNSGAGYLLVLSGKVKNEFSQNRSFVRVKGTLYGPDKKMVGKPVYSYCGNTLADEELASLNVEEIQKRLSDKNGKDNVNVNITPGKMISYMVVFSSIPDDVEEFAVEVAGSEPSEK